jgi:hypothetical protein
MDAGMDHHHQQQNQPLLRAVDRGEQGGRSAEDGQYSVIPPAALLILVARSLEVGKSVWVVQR